SGASGRSSAAGADKARAGISASVPALADSATGVCAWAASVGVSASRLRRAGAPPRRSPEAAPGGAAPRRRRGAAAPAWCAGAGRGGGASRDVGLGGSLRLLTEGAQGERRQLLNAGMSFSDRHRSTPWKGQKTLDRREVHGAADPVRNPGRIVAKARCWVVAAA